MSFQVVVVKNDNVEVFDSIRDAGKRLGVSAMTAGKALKGVRTKLRNDNIFIYKYEDYYGLKPIREHNVVKGEDEGKHTARPVHKLDRYTHKILHTYNNISEACADLQVPGVGLIALCCRGEREVAYDFKWEYAVEEK